MGSIDQQSVTNKKTIIRVLEETGFAYSLTCQAGESHGDYAEFVGQQALNSFQQALSNPALSYDDLCKLLRRASSREAVRQCKTPWHVFMANYLQKHCNNNATESLN